MTTTSNKLRRAIFGRNAKDGTEKSGTIKQGDDRSPAASSSQLDDRGAVASSSQDDDRNAAALAAFYSLLLGTEDERQTQQLTPVPDPTARPWSAICHLQSNYSDDESKSTTNGTGFLISDTTVLTAAHNLCWVKNGRKIEPRSLTVTLAGKAHPPVTPPNFASEPRFAAMKALQERNKELIRSPKLTREEKDNILARFSAFEDPYYYDYGVIFLDKPLEPKPDFFFKLRGADAHDPLWERPLTCAGFLSSDQLCHAAGMAHPSSGHRFMGNKDHLAVHNVFAVKGESGGPLHVVDGNGDYIAIGIFVRTNDGAEKYTVGDIKHSLQTNGAVRITKEMENLLNTNDIKGLLTRWRAEDLIA